MAYVNYWTEKINFRNNLQSNLLPLLLTEFVGKDADQKAVDQIGQRVVDFLNNQNQPSVWFDCVTTLETKVVFRKKTDDALETSVHVIEGIKILVLDIN